MNTRLGTVHVAVVCALTCVTPLWSTSVLASTSEHTNPMVAALDADTLTNTDNEPLGQTKTAVKASDEVLFTDLCQMVKPAPSSESTHQGQQPFALGEITINNNPIFDESDPDTILLHRFANWLHIETRKEVVQSQLPFATGEQITADDLAEAERILRGKHYLRDAKVSFHPSCEPGKPQHIVVNTFDNWSLLPEVGFSRSSGQNKSSFGFKEDNFLGYGMHFTFKYKSDHERTGYHTVVSMPSPLDPHAEMGFIYDNNDDGKLLYLNYEKPFYQDDSPLMYQFTATDNQRIDRVYQNGDELTRFATDYQFGKVSYGWLGQFTGKRATRYSVGVNYQQRRYQAVDLGADSVLRADLLPEDDKQFYPWLGIEYKTYDYKVLKDIYLINHNEDVNLGWHWYGQIGFDGQQQGSDAWLYQLSASKGWQWQDNLLLSEAQFDGQVNGTRGSRHHFAGQLAYFHHLNPRWVWYSLGQYEAVSKQWLEDPLALGGETGVRGFPMQFQHGSQKLNATTELRYYPQITVYKIIELGFVGFVDVGRAWGDSFVANAEDGLIGSAGLGARIYSSKSSNNNVVHIDLSTPIKSTPFVNSWEISVKVNRSF